MAAFLCSACAPLPSIPKRPDFTRIHEPGDKLQAYYNWRLTPSSDGGYHYGKLHIVKWRMGEFMDAQGDSVAAKWGGKGNAMIVLGWTLAAAVEAAAVGLSLQAGEGGTAKEAWWAAILPAGLVGWTFHWTGDNWFRRPAAAKYDLELKRELGLTRD